MSATSSHMFRDLVGRLSHRFHVLAPDSPGFGNSDCPDPEHFKYTFDNVSRMIERFLETLGVDRLSWYMHGGGVGVGMRICTRHPHWVDALIIQNGNCYEEGFREATKPWFEFWKNRNSETEAANCSDAGGHTICSAATASGSIVYRPSARCAASHSG